MPLILDCSSARGSSTEVSNNLCYPNRICQFSPTRRAKFSRFWVRPWGGVGGGVSRPSSLSLTWQKTLLRSAPRRTPGGPFWFLSKCPVSFSFRNVLEWWIYFGHWGHLFWYNLFPNERIRRPTETTHGQLDLFGGSDNAVQTQEIRKGNDCVKIR